MQKFSANIPDELKRIYRPKHFIITMIPMVVTVIIALIIGESWTFRGAINYVFIGLIGGPLILRILEVLEG